MTPVLGGRARSRRAGRRRSLGQPACAPQRQAGQAVAASGARAGIACSPQREDVDDRAIPGAPQPLALVEARRRAMQEHGGAQRLGAPSRPACCSDGSSAAGRDQMRLHHHAELQQQRRRLEDAHAGAASPRSAGPGSGPCTSAAALTGARVDRMGSADPTPREARSAQGRGGQGLLVVPVSASRRRRAGHPASRGQPALRQAFERNCPDNRASSASIRVSSSGTTPAGSLAPKPRM